MSKYRIFLNIVDFVFEIFIVLLIALIWSRYFIDNFALSITVAIVTTALISFSISKRKIKKKENLKTLIKSKKKMEEFKNYFLFLSPSAVLNKILKKENGVISPYNENIILCKNKLIIVIRQMKPTSKEDILTYLQKLDTKLINEITILTPAIEPDCLNYLKTISNINFEIKLVDKIAQDYFEEEINDDKLAEKCKIKFKQSPIITLKTFFIMLLRPENAKGYFFSAIILLFASLIVPHKLYYYIFASILLLLVLYSKIIKRKST